MGKLTGLFTFFTIGRDTLEIPSKNKKKPASTVVETGSSTTGGGRGIRTHETFLPTGFQDQLHRPLGQTSATQFSGNCKNSSGEPKTSQELNAEALGLIEHASNFSGSYGASS